MYLLRREIAPITDEAWRQLDNEAKQVLKAHLSARSLVDFSGPHGWEYGAVNTGRLQLREHQEKQGVHWGQRDVLPLIEVRVPFHLRQLELDYIPRGAKDINWEPLEEAARQVTLFEETAVYKGFAEGGIIGMFEVCRHCDISLAENSDQFVAAIARGQEMLREEQVEGPLALVLGPPSFKALKRDAREGYPLQKTISAILPEARILWSPAIDGGVLLSTRGGDFELTVGQDLSIGYCSHDRQQVELYITESFAFRVLEPEAAVVLDWQG